MGYKKIFIVFLTDKLKKMMITIILIIIILLLLVSALIFLLLKIRQVKHEEKEDEEKRELLEKSIKLEGKARTPKESLVMLHNISGKFFKGYINDKKEMTYLEMAKRLKNQKMSKFCERMDYLLYSGTKITKEDALEMINDFNEIINNAKK
jgi:hypothetical protein